MSADVRIAADPAGVLADAKAFLVELIRATCAQRESCSIALAGGSTPRPLYAALAREELPWPALQLYLGDERCVPADDARSNARMVRESLLEPLGGRAPAFHTPKDLDRDAHAAAERYAALLPARLDIVLVGVGADGHTASLFPGAAALLEEERRVVVADAPTPPRRITITPPVLRAAGTCVVLCSGAEKSAAVARALESDAAPNEVPAALLRDGVWFLDRAAASELVASR